MWNFFQSKPLLSENDALFQLECFKWLLKHFGGDAFYKETALVLPTKEYFPAKVDSKEDAVQYTRNWQEWKNGLADLKLRKKTRIR